MNQLGFVQAVSRFSQRIVITVTPATDRWLDLGLGQPLAVTNAEILRPRVGVMDQGSIVAGLPSLERLFQRVQEEIRSHR